MSPQPTATTVELSAPTLLLAMPQLCHGPFAQAVLLLIQHGPQGSMGLMVNRPSPVTLNHFAAGLGVQFAQSGQQELFVGGPVESERAFILHGGNHRGPETASVMPQMALSFSMESLTALAQHTPETMRICVGYAGWGPNQLAQEIARGAWLLSEPDPQFIFNTPPVMMWHSALRSMGIEPMQLLHVPTGLH